MSDEGVRRPPPGALSMRIMFESAARVLGDKKRLTEAAVARAVGRWAGEATADYPEGGLPSVYGEERETGAIVRLVCRSEEEVVTVRGWMRAAGFDGPIVGVKTPEWFPPHPAADLFPMMDDAALAELGADMRAHGQAHPIVIYKAMVLDGRNRQRACQLVGLTPQYVWWDGRGRSPVDFVVSLNLHRRHLTAEQKRAVIAALVKEDPARSNRQVADKVGTDHKTVAKVRERLESVGEIPQLEKTTGKGGKSYPARRGGPRPPEPVPEHPQSRGKKAEPPESADPGPAFDHAEEARSLRDWICSRREAWPEALRCHFLESVRYMLRQIENDERHSADPADCFSVRLSRAPFSGGYEPMFGVNHVPPLNTLPPDEVFNFVAMALECRARARRFGEIFDEEIAKGELSKEGLQARREHDVAPALARTEVDITRFVAACEEALLRAMRELPNPKGLLTGLK